MIPIIVLAIDPGPTESGFALYAHEQPCPVLDSGKLPTARIIAKLRAAPCQVVVIEAFTSYGRPVGAECFDSVRNSGRFEQVWLERSGRPPLWSPRRIAARELCGTPHAKDAHIRAAIIDRFGGSKQKAVGLKATPGPLYGVKADAWLALAHAITFFEMLQRGEKLNKGSGDAG